jgi:hypothetical protein
VEEEALAKEEGVVHDSGVVGGLADLVRGRMAELFDRLVGLIGQDQAEDVLSALPAQKDRLNHGHHE